MINCNDKFDKWNNEKKKLQIKENKIISIGKIYWALLDDLATNHLVTSKVETGIQQKSYL